MNKIFLLGRLVKDPVSKVTTQGKGVTTFTLAVDRPFKGRDGKYEADFINIVAWDKTGGLVQQHVHKGQRLLVEGRLQIRYYDGKDGARHYVTEVIADRVEFVERKEKTAGTADSGGSTGNFESMGQEVQQDAPLFDEEIPF